MAVEIKRVSPTSGCCDDVDVTPRLDDGAAADAALLFKALADPTRLQILDLLSQREGDLCVCDLQGRVGPPDGTGQRPAQPTISHHLRVLREAGLVGRERRGVWAFYFLQRARLGAAQDLLARIR